MQREHAITRNGMRVGTAYIATQGLYYELICVCKMQDGVLRVEADCGNRKENIGVCVPKDGKMVIRTRIPQKRLQGLVGFTIRQGTEKQWIPLKRGEPFPYLYRMKEACYTYSNGVPGLLLPSGEGQDDFSVSKTGK